VTTEQSDYEAKFLALAGRHEGLQRKCACGDCNYAHDGCAKCEEYDPDRRFPLISVEEQYAICIVAKCITCGERGWLPLPEAERAGALMRVLVLAGAYFHIEGPSHWTKDQWLVAPNFESENSPNYYGNTPEEALTNAATAAGL